MIQIQVLCFGIATDICGFRTKEITLNDGTSIESMKTFLLNQYPELQKLKHLSLAVNEEYGKANYILQENDEVVIMPPVSGG